MTKINSSGRAPIRNPGPCVPPWISKFRKCTYINSEFFLYRKTSLHRDGKNSHSGPQTGTGFVFGIRAEPGNAQLGFGLTVSSRRRRGKTGTLSGKFRKLYSMTDAPNRVKVESHIVNGGRHDS